MIAPEMGDEEEAGAEDGGDGSTWLSSRLLPSLILSSNIGDRLRPPLLIRSELLDRTRLNVMAEMVVPATGDALTIVPGIGVGDGDGLSERKRG